MPESDVHEVFINNRIITISREFGSGGRTIRKIVAESLGIHCYDSEITEKIAEENGFAKEYVASYDENVSVENIYDNTRGAMIDKMWFAQKKVITELAEKSACVIVGRCADHILRNTSECITVFVHASDDKRAERIVSEYGQRNEEPEKRIADKDKIRKKYYEGISKNLPSFRCAVDLVGRLHNKIAGILTYVKIFCAI